MKLNIAPFSSVALILGIAAVELASLSAGAAVIADSVAEFSGEQRMNGWSNGYRNLTWDAGEENYDSKNDFVPYDGGEGQGAWDEFFQHWTGEAWDLNTAAAGPWTTQSAESIHPNGENSFPNEEHWAIRRWSAEELNGETLLQIDWSVRKENTGGGNGVTGGIWVNGTKLIAIAISGGDGVGVTRTNYLIAQPTDVIDLVLSPVGLDGGRGDGSDGSITTMVIEIAEDSDGDQLPDNWEEIYSPGDLTVLTGSSDGDGDGLNSLAELRSSTDPTKTDTDEDGLPDGVETNTGVFVSASNTGTDPLRKDMDGDGRDDGDEINGSPSSDVFIADTDDDGFLDGFEASSGHDPSDPNENPAITAFAQSNLDFSGFQGDLNWNYGYRNFTADGGGADYDPEASFVEFTETEFTGSQWDLNTAPAAPWTELGTENTHPNGSNNSEVHWTIRRWVASDLTTVTPLAFHWHTRKSNTGGGNGVTGALHIDGKEVDKATIAFNDDQGVLRTYYANIAPGDIVDLVLRPTGTNGDDSDGSDGSINWLLVDPVLPPVALQPDGSTFIPAGASDTDADGIPDAWERLYFANDLSKLTREGDGDGDGLSDLLEFQRDSNPTLADTDGEGLSDLVETASGIFVSIEDTGSDPKKADTDGDGLSDREEVFGSPQTNPNKVDSDGDTFSDSDEIGSGTDPNDGNDNVLSFVISNSIDEFSGVQGQDGWFNGYRNYTLDGGSDSYDPENDFIPYTGGVDDGAWDEFFQHWTGSAWDLNTAAAGPWTSQNAQGTHPNGENSFPNEEHWAIRRWVASEISKETPVAIIWQIRKENPSGDGVTGGIYVNGEPLDTVTIEGGDTSNPIRRVYANLNPNDTVDLAITPEGVSDRSDGSDGSITWFWVDTRIPADPRQPDGTVFGPAGRITFESATYDSAQNRIILTWPSSAGATYTIEASEDLTNWNPVQQNLPSAGTTTTYSEPLDPGGTLRFYRLRQ